MADQDNEPTLSDVTARIATFMQQEAQQTGAPGVADASTEMLSRPARDLELTRYEIGKIIGEGGMGRVRLAHDRALERPVALKTLQVADGEKRRQFARECGIAGRLEHPNIVPLYDAGVDKAGRPYLAMRYIEGDSLRSVIQKLKANDDATMKRYSLEARCRIVLQLLSALDLAHARGVLHRDIKPDNVMLGPFGEVLLVDWGIACTKEESASPQEKQRGTLRYMSPEQVDGAPLDERSDLYSLALVAYELLTLQHPLTALGTDAERMMAIVGRPVLAAEHVRVPGHPVVPRALSLVVMQGLEKQRDARWSSAAAMQRALETVLAGDAPIVCPHTAYARGLTFVGRVLDRFPRFTYVGTMALVALAAVGAYALGAAVVEALAGGGGF